MACFTAAYQGDMLPAGEVDEYTNDRGRGDEGRRRQPEDGQRRRAQAALVADHPAEEAREQAEPPHLRPPRGPAFGPARQARTGGEQEQGWLILRNGETTIGLFRGMFEGNLLTSAN